MHRLVAETFIDNPLHKEQVNHIDGNKLNNNVANLEWNTRNENVLHAYRLGLMSKTAFDKAQKPILQCDLEGNVIKEWKGIRECAKELNVLHGGIVGCIKGRRPTAYGYKWKYKD